MNPTVKEARPSYVRFERRALEDRDATIAKGHYVAKDRDVVLITPMGSKDCYEKFADEWFVQLKQQVTEERLPQEWYEAYARQYEAWKSGQELPVDGTPILTWPALSPAQAKMLVEWNVLTVERLAEANEDLIMRLGMGARALVERAKSWVQTKGGDLGKLAEQQAALQAQMKDLKEANEKLAKQNAELVAKAGKAA